MNTKKIILIFTTLTIIFLFIYIYFLKNTIYPTETTATSLPAISINIAPASHVLLINQTIINRKLDEKYGYKLNIVISQPQDNIPSLLMNKTQITYLGPSEVLKLNEDGKDLKMFSFGLKTFCPFIAKNSFNTASENFLKGKKIAIVKRPSEPYMVLEKIMENNSQKLIKYFNVVETDTLSLPILLSKDEVEISHICNIVSMSKLLSKDDQYKIIDSTENMIKKQMGDNNIPLLVLITQRQWIENNYELAKAYINSQKEALIELQNNFDNIFTPDELSEKFGLDNNGVKTLKYLIKDNNHFSFPDWEKSIKDIQKFNQKNFDESNFIILK